MRIGSDGKVYFGNQIAVGSNGYILKETSGDYKFNIFASSSTTTNRIITFNSRSNVEAMRIAADGHVGINSTTPRTHLDVRGNFYFHNNMLVSNWDSSGAGGSNIDHIWHSDASNYGRGGTWNFCSDSAAKVTGNSAIQIGFLKSSGGGYFSGDVGIGITDPAGGSSLHINGTGTSDKPHIRLTADRGLIGRFGDTSGSAQAMFDLYGTDGSTQIVRFISGGGVNFVNTGGNLGIGTDNPAKLLDVHSTNTNTYSSSASNTPNNGSVIQLTNKAGTDGSGSGYYSAIKFSIANGATSSGYLTYHRTGDNQGDFTFKSRNASSSYPELVRIKSTGKVLVNKPTTSDYGKLEVKGGTADNIETADITAKTVATFSGSTPGTTAAGKGVGIVIKPIADRGCNYFIGVANDSSNQEAHGRFIIRSGNFAGTTSERLRIDSSGNVQLSTGNLIMGTNNKGLSFANSSSSPDADSTSSTRIMTDYDEGTCDWEVHRSDGLTTGDNHGDTKVSYTKIGNRVFMSGYVYTRNTGSGTSGLTAIMTDASGNAASLPYTPSHHGTMPITHTRTLIEYARMSVGFESGSKTVYIHTDEGNNSYTPAQNDVGIHNSQTHLVLAFTGSYLTSE